MFYPYMTHIASVYLFIKLLIQLKTKRRRHFITLFITLAAGDSVNTEMVTLNYNEDEELKRSAGLPAV